MQVTSRGFRAWRVRPMSQRQRDDMVLLAHIREQHRLSLQSYGRPRMTEELRELGLNVGHRRVGRLMRDNGIKILRTQKYKATTDSNHTFNIAPNLLDQDFSADAQTKSGLATYPISGPVKAGCIRALDMAVALRQPPEGAFTIQIADRNTVPTSINDAFPSMASRSR